MEWECLTPEEPASYPGVPGVPDASRGSSSHSLLQFRWCPLPPWDVQDVWVGADAVHVKLWVNKDEVLAGPVPSRNVTRLVIWDCWSWKSYG